MVDMKTPKPCFHHESDRAPRNVNMSMSETGGKTPSVERIKLMRPCIAEEIFLQSCWTKINDDVPSVGLDLDFPVVVG